jgi:TetR/AcrR family transcriptional repressor of nem operon
VGALRASRCRREGADDAPGKEESRRGPEAAPADAARLDEKPAADRAEVVLKRYLSPAHRDNTESGCPLPAVVGEVGTTAAEHRDVLGTQVDAMASELAVHLPASESGTPKRYIALGLVALMYGGLSISRALRGTELSDEMLKACRALGRLAARNDLKT